jgi:16S rRNA (cytosine967-C5)-methyltransferase
VSVSIARRVAFEVLCRVEASRAFASDLLHARLGSRLKRQPSHSREEAALATELTLGTLRWQRLLDFLISHQTGKPTESLDFEVRIALRLGLYQLRFLRSVPPRAAVHQSVELVKWAKKRSAGSLVNAVLRRAPLGPLETLLPASLPPAERLGILHSHPDWLVERWLVAFGPERTLSLLQANNCPPRLTCWLHQPDRLPELEQEFRAAGLELLPGQWLPHCYEVRGGNPALTDACRRGWISIQDEASLTIPSLLPVESGDCVLDLCAAPGGKTALLARAAAPGLVIAADRSSVRLRTARSLLARLALPNVCLLVADGERALPFSRLFDRILVDAPCSGTGTLARHPEIRWRLAPSDLADLQARQVRLVSSALRHLAPGGTLLYSTCSLEPEENEQVIERILTDHPAVRRLPFERPHGLVDTRGYFRTFPPEHHSDGFFAALLTRLP